MDIVLNLHLSMHIARYFKRLTSCLLAQIITSSVADLRLTNSGGSEEMLLSDKSSSARDVKFSIPYRQMIPYIKPRFQ